MHIAICDDEAMDRDEVLSVLQTYSLQKKTPFIYHIFDNGFSLLESIEAGSIYDIILLDIIMPNITGIETARHIRKTDSTVKIVFLTSSPEFAVDSYSVGAYYYLLKPINPKNLVEVVDKISRSSKSYEAASILINDRKGIRRIPLSELVFCEILRRTVCYHFIDGSVSESTGTLSELENDLLPYSFVVKPHRSYLVNLRHVTEISLTEIKTDIGKTVPISRGRYEVVSHAFLASAFAEAFS